MEDGFTMPEIMAKGPSAVGSPVISSLPRPHVPSAVPGTEPEAARDRRGYLPHLDVVRGTACLMVLAAHLKAIPALHWVHDQVGTAGVGLFFAMSGFLITRILISDKAAGRGLNAFYNRRAARIFPIYFLVLAVLWLLWPGRELGWAASFSFNLNYVTGAREYFHVDAGERPIPPIAHFWSLCVEEHYYWFWPALVWLLPTRFYRWLPALCVAATPPVTYLVLTQLRARGFQDAALPGMIWRLTPTQLVALSYGALVAIYERPLLTRSLRVFRANIPPLMVVGAVSLIAAVGGWLVLFAVARGATTRLIWQPTLLHLGCGGLLALGLCFPILGRLRALCGVGRISYGVYLFHLPVYAALGLAQSAAPVAAWRGAVAVTVTFVLAALSFRLLESPILAWVRGRHGGVSLHYGRLALSPGSLMTLALGALFLVQVASWARTHPKIPEELRDRAVGNSVAPSGYMHMGIHHDLDKNGFRRSTPFPPRTPGLPRVAIVGDSYTFGQCVEADQVLSAVTQRLLKERGVGAEVLNLGRCGAQAEDVLETIRNFAVPLQSRVVVYAAVVDDLLPSGQGIVGHTFKDLRTNPAFVKGFREAVRAMNETCRANGTILRVIPFTQQPNDSETIATVRLIQSLCREEKVPLIEIESYLRENAHRHFKFHQLDSHPNAECHRLYGQMVAEELVRLHECGELQDEARPASSATEGISTGAP
jgi:peptidoglycan/LPS O-acetylase OafA/YrhL